MALFSAFGWNTREVLRQIMMKESYYFSWWASGRALKRFHYKKKEVILQKRREKKRFTMERRKQYNLYGKGVNPTDASDQYQRANSFWAKVSKKVWRYTGFFLLMTPTIYNLWVFSILIRIGPHIASSSRDTRLRMATMVAKNLARGLSAKYPSNLEWTIFD